MIRELVQCARILFKLELKIAIQPCTGHASALLGLWRMLTQVLGTEQCIIMDKMYVTTLRHPYVDAYIRSRVSVWNVLITCTNMKQTS